MIYYNLKGTEQNIYLYSTTVSRDYVSLHDKYVSSV
jgi:hypothetical protein